MSSACSFCGNSSRRIGLPRISARARTPSLHDVRHLVEARGAGDGGSRDAELRPQGRARHPQLPDRRAEQVLDDDRVAVGTDDDPLGSEGAVRQVPGVPVEGSHGGGHLLQDVERGVEIRRHPLALRERQQLGQAGPRHRRGHDGQAAQGAAEPLDATNLRERGVREAGQPPGALDERGLGGRRFGQLPAQAEGLDLFTGRIHRPQASADAVHEGWCVHGRVPACPHAAASPFVVREGNADNCFARPEPPSQTWGLGRTPYA